MVKTTKTASILQENRGRAEFYRATVFELGVLSCVLMTRNSMLFILSAWAAITPYGSPKVLCFGVRFAIQISIT